MSVEVEAPSPPAAAPLPPPEIRARPARTLDTLVPRDRFFWIRVVALTMYGLGYVWWFRNRGLIIDRISVAVSVAIFLVAAFAGKPWRRWAILVVDAALYAGMWLAYEMTRGSADRGLQILGTDLRVRFPLQLTYARDIDRALFLGTDVNVWMQRRFYHPNDIKWYDNVASATYYTHFVIPVVAMAVLWAASRVQWVRFMRRFASLLAVACVSFVVLPTAPPWMLASRRYDYGLLPPLTRHTGRGFYDLGFKGFVKSWDSALDWSNAVAAMPSLHAAFALFVPAFFLPWIRPRWLKGLVLVFPLMMLTALVYFGEHWVVDGVAGWLLVAVSFYAWNRIERWLRSLRAERARAALQLGA